MKLISLYQAAEDLFYNDKLSTDRWRTIRATHQYHQDKLEKRRRKAKERAMQRRAARSMRQSP